MPAIRSVGSALGHLGTQVGERVVGTAMQHGGQLGQSLGEFATNPAAVNRVRNIGLTTMGTGAIGAGLAMKGAGDAVFGQPKTAAYTQAIAAVRK